MTVIRTTFRLTAALVVMTINCPVKAAHFDLAPGPDVQVQTIKFDAPALSPIAYSRFCIRYKDDCAVRRMAFRRPHPEILSASRLRDLLDVNQEVNQAISPKDDAGGLLAERWRIAPKAGACHDYAVTKRHELLDRGWPSRSLLLAEVVAPSGEHHLVLVARTDAGDLVLDNLTPSIRYWTQTPYQWVRIQSQDNPALWFTIARVAT